MSTLVETDMSHEIVEYRGEHYHEISTWFMKRRLNVPKYWVFSDIGFIVDHCIAGFLYLTNSGICRLDGFISNPDSPKDRRSGAVDVLVKRLIASAYANDCKMIMCNTQLPVIEKKALQFGFKDLGEFKAFAKGI